MDTVLMASTLRNLRRSMGKKQSEVARECEISPAAYASYETGSRIPRDDVKEKLSGYFGKTVGYIFFGERAH